VCVTVVITWIILAGHISTFSTLASDVVHGNCVSYGVFRSEAAKTLILASYFMITYMLPAMSMVFCYCRIVHALKHKVTATQAHTLRYVVCLL